MRGLVAEAGLDGEVEIESAGTGSWHLGDPPDPRAVAAAAERGVQLDGAARQVDDADFDRFDLVIAMDQSNRDTLLRLAPSDGGTRTGAAVEGVRRRRGGRRPGPVLRWRGRIRGGRGDRRALLPGAARRPPRRTDGVSAPASEAFVKTRAGASPADFEAEAAGLRWLGEAGAPVPRILGVNDQPPSLTLERIGPGTLSRDGAERLGRELASVHRAGAPAHGALPPGSPDEALKDRPGAPDAERARRLGRALRSGSRPAAGRTGARRREPCERGRRGDRIGVRPARRAGGPGGAARPASR